MGPASEEISEIVRFAALHARIKTNVCSQQRHDHGYRLDLRTIPDYNLIFVTRGKVVWVVNGRDMPLEKEQLLLVPPDVPHSGYNASRRITVVSIHVEASLPGGRDVFALLNPPPVRRVEPGTRLSRYLYGAAAEWRRSDQTVTRMMLEHWSKLIVPELILYDGRRGLLSPRPLDPIVADMLETLPARIERPVSLAELSRESGYTPQHLNRLFHRTLGVTPLQFLARLRMEKAASLLADGRHTVGGVARQVGFDDPYYFSRLFKSHFGQSPRRYQEAAGSNNPSRDSGDPFNRGGGRR